MKYLTDVAVSTEHGYQTFEEQGPTVEVFP